MSFTYNPSGDVLGYIIWFTVRAAWVKPADLIDWFDDLMLDHRYINTRLSKAEAFRRAFSPKEHTFRWTDDSGTEHTLYLEEVKLEKVAARDRSIRRIMLKSKNPRNASIDVKTEIAQATFWRAPETVSVTRFGILDPDVETRVAQYVSELEARFERRCEYLDTDKLRGVLRNYIEGLNATPVRDSGGVYFLPASRASTLASLQELAARFSARSGLTAIPLPDEAEHRDMVVEAFNEEVVERCDRLLAEILEIGAADTLSPTRMKHAKTAYVDLTSRIEEYAQALGFAQDRARMSLEMVEERLIALTEDA